MFYKIFAKFAKAGAPSFYTPGYQEYLEEAKHYFNKKSRVATNPKEITDLSIIDDATIRITLRSHDVLRLEQISRSLQQFSAYLTDETHTLNFRSLRSGRRLSRMQASELASDEIEDTQLRSSNGGEDVKIDKFQMVEKLCLLLREMNKSSENLEAVKKIETVLKTFLERRSCHA